MAQIEQILNQDDDGDDDQEEKLAPMIVRSSRILLSIRTTNLQAAKELIATLGIEMAGDQSEETAVEENEARKAEGKSQLRKGMGDTGHPIFGTKIGDDRYQQWKATMVKADNFVRDVIADGYRLAYAWWRFEPILRQGKPTGKDRILIRIGFSGEKIDRPIKAEKIKHLADVLDHLLVITDMFVFSELYAFENPNSSDTVNLNGWQPTENGATHNILRFAAHDNAIEYTNERVADTVEKQDNNYRIAACRNPAKVVKQ